MGLIGTTVKASLAVVIAFAALVVIDTRFAILADWIPAILALATSGQIPSEVWGLLMIVGLLVGMKLYDDWAS